MISISRLLCDTVGPGDHLRYVGAESGDSLNKPPRPIVVWNCTRRCNLNCIHCYASADVLGLEEQMDTGEGKAFIRDLAEFGAPVLLFSGGEPLLRDDIFELAGFAVEQGIRPVLSTNGTLITDTVAEKIKNIGFGEIGISLDGVGEINDRFRGQEGAYKAALQGIRRCIDAGQRVSLRFTITRSNYKEIPGIFNLAEREGIPRICFYHLVYSGRAEDMRKEDLEPAETRAVVDMICDSTLDLYRRGYEKEVLTVGNHADGVYLYLKLKQDEQQANKVLGLLSANGGNNSGIRIGAVDDLGNVHPDQFWWHYSFGNVRKRKFGDIWMDTSDPMMRGLKDRKPLLKGRCSRCQYLDLCNGNHRVRAQVVSGDVWGEDPACYLTDEEIGLL
ncbi:radical SAM protein [Chloroflexota bacterium]